MQTPDVVVLVPGFLGFTHLGGFYYFADRLIGVLRGLLEEPLGYPVPFVPVTTLQTDCLRNLQDGLLQNLAGVCENLSGVDQLHMICYSTCSADSEPHSYTISLHRPARAIPSSRTCTGSRRDRKPCRPPSSTVTASSASWCRSSLTS